MKIRYYPSFIFLPFLFLSQVYGQYETVDYNDKMGYFNNGQPLPAESNLIITGTTSRDIDWVEIELFRGGSDKYPMAQSLWKRDDDSEATSYKIPLNYRLRGNSTYDFVFTTFRQITVAEKTALTEKLLQSLHIYLEQISVGQAQSMQLQSAPNKVMKDLNKVIVEGIYYYRSKNGKVFPGFSDIVKSGLEKLHKAPGSLAPTLQAIRNETEQYFQPDWFILIEKKRVSNYATLKGRGTLSVNVGYGGVYLDGDLDNLSYDTAPYVGLSFPLGNRFLSNSILSNTSFSVGVFMGNFTDADSAIISGPIFGRPYYMGLGYSFFRFVRLNVGCYSIGDCGEF